jgi:hypothetical protein
MEWEEILVNHTSDEGIMSKIYKEHRQLNYEKKIDLRIGQDLD